MVLAQRATDLVAKQHWIVEVAGEMIDKWEREMLLWL
jgi:hypothetical protein